MFTPFTPFPAAATVADFNARMIESVVAAIEEAGVDAEITDDHGLELDEETALEVLEESDTYRAIRDPELRDAYRGAYVAAFISAT